MTTHRVESEVPVWTIADRLRKAREKEGITQQELADDIGVSRRSISSYELGDTEPRKPVLVSWAMRCKVPLEWLQSGNASPIHPNGGVHNGGYATQIRGASRSTHRELVTLSAAA